MDKDGMTLKEFIEKNHILLSTVAVFATIVALLSNLPIRWMGTLLSFIFIAGIVIVWHEIQTQLPKKMGPKLFLFRYVLLWGLWGFIFYWLLEFREIWHVFLFVLLFAMFLYLILSSLKPLTEWKFLIKVFGIGQSKTKLQKFLRGIILFIIGYFSLYAASLFSVPLNLILDAIKNTFK